MFGRMRKKARTATINLVLLFGLLVPVYGQWTEQILHSFGVPNQLDCTEQAPPSHANPTHTKPNGLSIVAASGLATPTVLTAKSVPKNARHPDARRKRTAVIGARIAGLDVDVVIGARHHDVRRMGVHRHGRLVLLIRRHRCRRAAN